MLILSKSIFVQSGDPRMSFVRQMCGDDRFAGTQSTPKVSRPEASAESSCASPMNTWTVQRHFRRYVHQRRVFSACFNSRGQFSVAKIIFDTMTGHLLQAPKGRHAIAQGNALGSTKKGISTLKGRHTAGLNIQLFRPFRARFSSCPGTLGCASLTQGYHLLPRWGKTAENIKPWAGPTDLLRAIVFFRAGGVRA